MAVLSSVIERKSHGEDPGGSILRNVGNWESSQFLAGGQISRSDSQGSYSTIERE